MEDEVTLMDAASGTPVDIGQELVEAQERSAFHEGIESPFATEFVSSQAEYVSKPFYIDQLEVELVRMRHQLVKLANSAEVLPLHYASVLDGGSRVSGRSRSPRYTTADATLDAYQRSRTSGVHLHLQERDLEVARGAVVLFREWAPVIMRYAAASPFAGGYFSGSMTTRHLRNQPILHSARITDLERGLRSARDLPLSEKRRVLSQVQGVDAGRVDMSLDHDIDIRVSANHPTIEARLLEPQLLPDFDYTVRSLTLATMASCVLEARTRVEDARNKNERAVFPETPTLERQLRRQLAREYGDDVLYDPATSTMVETRTAGRSLFEFSHAGFAHLQRGRQRPYHYAHGLDVMEAVGSNRELLTSLVKNLFGRRRQSEFREWTRGGGKLPNDINHALVVSVVWLNHFGFAEARAAEVEDQTLTSFYTDADGRSRYSSYFEGDRLEERLALESGVDLGPAKDLHHTVRSLADAASRRGPQLV